MRTLLLLVIAALLVLTQGESALRTAQRWSGISDFKELTDQVTSTKRATTLASQNLREQIISFDTMQSLDSSFPLGGDLYAIGVGQVTLNEPEQIAKLGRGRGDSEIDTTYGEGRPPTIYGAFNNVLLFDKRTGELARVFKERVAIQIIQPVLKTKPAVIVFLGTNADTNGDGLLDGDDQRSAFIYSLIEKTTHKIEVPGVNFHDVVWVPDADYIIIRGAVERAPARKLEPDEVDISRKPYTLIRVDLKTFKAAPFVPPAMALQLQQTLDASPATSAPAPEATAPITPTEAPRAK